MDNRSHRKHTFSDFVLSAKLMLCDYSRYKCSIGLNRGWILSGFSDELTSGPSVNNGRGWRDSILLDGESVGLFGGIGD